MDWIYLAENKERWRTVMNVVTNLRVLYNAGNFLTFWGSAGFSRRTLLRGVSEKFKDQEHLKQQEEQ